MSAHPDWCARGHRCALGEHRSDPWTIRTRYGAVVATRVQHHGGRDRLEVRAVVDLPAGDQAGQDVTRLVLLAIDLGIRDALARRLARMRAAYQRLTGTRVRG